MFGFLRMPPTQTAATLAACAALAAPSFAASATARSAADSAAHAIDAYVKPLVARGDLSGQLLVHRHGRLVAERSYGMANAELRSPVTPETRFNVASVTKPMTSTIAIQLITEGKLALDDSIGRWLPDFPKGDSIRVEHLLRHRSGIPHETVPDSEMTRPYTAAQVVERARRLPLDWSPGSRGGYSSGGFEVLARVLELASGKSYSALLAERVFGPLRMTHSAHADSRALLPGRATGYVPGADTLENAPLQDFSALVGAGSVWSTARDLHRLVAGLVAGTLGEGPRQSFVRGGVLDFSGRTGGFKAWAMWDSTSGVEAVFVGNLATGAPDQLKRDILGLAMGEPKAPPALPPPSPVRLTDEAMHRWEGVYQIENGPRLELRVRDGALYSNDWVMRPLADGTLFSPRDYGIVRGVSGSDGRLTRLDWVQGTQSYPAPRVSD